MSDELKPCPHCGSATAPEISNCVELESCANFDECPCETHLCVVCSVHNGGCGACGGFAASEDDAISKWNTRVAVTDEQFAVAVHDGHVWRAERTCHMNHVLLYDEEAVDGVECDECFYTEVHSLDDPLPDRCPGCDAKVVG